MSKRRITYLSGTRADFGLMRSTLVSIAGDPRLALTVAATGMHLSPRFGETIREIESAGFERVLRVEADAGDGTGAGMARMVARVIDGMTLLLKDDRPDVLLILGDRGEMLGGAIAAIHQNIVIAHIHGGERSGTVDEPVRHAITKLAHYHLVATEASRTRVISMGEHADRVVVTGAPGLDEILGVSHPSREQVAAAVGLDPARPIAIVLYHPLLQTADAAGREMDVVLRTALDAELQLICLMPNADAGNQHVRMSIARTGGHEDVRIFTHAPRENFLSWLARFDLMLGNSSSGIIEAASFGMPVVNVGPRQQLRERNENVIDAGLDHASLRSAIAEGLKRGRSRIVNVYGDGFAGARIVETLATLDVSESVLHKVNVY